MDESGARWLGPLQIILRTRQARKAGDIGQAVRALAEGVSSAIGLKFRSRQILILTDPALVGALLVEHAPQTTKSVGLQQVRGLLGNGLLTSEGPDHRRVRRLVAPAFSPRRLAGYTAIFAEQARAQSLTWSDGQIIDAHHEMSTVTLDVVGQTLLGVDLAGDSSDIRDGLERALTSFNNGGPSGGLAAVLRRCPPAPPVQADTQAPIHALVDKIIDDRRANLSGDRGDVISALLAASAQPDGLTAAEVHDNVMTLMMAGHETTSNALSWTLDLLGRNPAVQARLHAEVSKWADQAPTTEDLAQLPYTRAVVTEAMRLYPPAWIFGRTLSEPTQFGPYKMPVGSSVMAVPLLLHHDRRWFTKPELFLPER